MKRGCTVIMANPPTGTGESNVPGLWPQTSRDGRARDGEFAFRGEIRILSFPSSGRLGGRQTARRLFAPRDGGGAGAQAGPRLGGGGLARGRAPWAARDAPIADAPGMVPVLKMEVSSRRGTPGTRAVRGASRHWPFRAVPEPPSVQVGVEIRLQGVMRMYAFGDLTTPCRRPAQRIVYYAGFIREPAIQTGPADMPALPLLVLVVSVLNLVSRPLQNAISRRVERAADRTALELTNDLADFAPPRVVVLLLHAHPPPTVERIRMAEAFAARQARSHQCTSPSHSFPAGEPTSEEESDR